MRAFRIQAVGTDLPVTDAAARAALSLPLWTEMREDEVERVGAAIERIRDHGGAARTEAAPDRRRPIRLGD
jgi:dTDP-4-amino-4,6-dideoxygalactose transaminase